MVFTGTAYPDLSFSFGAVPRAKKRQIDKQYERSLATQEGVDYGALSDWYEGKTSVLGQSCSISDRPLFIESPKSSRKLRGNYGKHGITRFGRKFVRNACLLLERKYGKERLGFVTCTLPSLPRGVHSRLNAVWGEVVRRFYQKLRRQLKKISKPFIYTGVTEIQEKRYQDSGIPAPHLHFVYLCRDSKHSRYWVYVCQIHRAWNEAVREGIGLCGYPHTMSPVPGWGSVHCKRVSKSAAAYLGKYMSKGGTVLKSMQEAGWVEFPRQWWTACLQCKKMFKDSLIRMDSHVCNALFYNLEYFLEENLVSWATWVEVPVHGCNRTIGMSGTFTPQGYSMCAID